VVDRSFGGLVALYTAQRVVLFLLAVLLLAALGMRGLPLLAVALLASSVLSLFVMRGRRGALTAALAQRAGAKAAERERLQERLREE
jgi:Protein of unknown function (DUF4229)